MREILFRAQSKDEGEWVYGWYEMASFGAWPLKPSIIPSDTAINGCYEHVEIKIETLGQYANKNDIHGKKIFDGDIIQVPFWRPKESGLFMKGVVEFHNSAFSVLWEYADYGRNFLGYIDDIEVIGNIHDNPELIPHP